ncbi:MAG: hypothetical protein K2N73_10145 [Lachnospiraceae bacterium]|nr:hypothetical protein [Lachnospiraceae bacterium]
MRIIIKEGYSLVIKEIKEVVMLDDKSALGISEQRKKYLTGEQTEELFKKILTDGYADLSGFDYRRYVREVLL